MTWFKDIFANPARVLCAAVLAMIAVMVVVVWLSGALTGGKRAQIEAQLGANRADAALATGADAVNAVARQAAAEGAADLITRENQRAINQAPGAAAPVDPAVRDAGLAGLCKRAAYRGSEQCLRFTPAR